MAAAANIVTSLEAISQNKGVLRKDFGDLEAQKEAIALCSEGWSKVEKHLTGMEAALRKRYEEIVEKEKALDARMKESQESLDKREGVIANREQASIVHVQEQKEAAVATIREQKRKWNEERQRLESSGCATQAAKQGSSKMANKKNASGKKDVSVKKAADKLQSSQTQAMGVDEARHKAAKVQKRPSEDAADRGSQEEDNGEEMNEDEKTHGEGGAPMKEDDASKQPVHVRPWLRTLCESMNGAGLRKYVAEQKKEINALRKELPYALKCAPDPCGIVMKALEGYHLIEATVRVGLGKKKDAGPSANRRGCILLLESLAELLADEEQPMIPSSVKEAAKGIADLWKSKLKTGGTEALVFLDAQSFLQLLATFQLASEYDKDELNELIVFVARRKQTPALCRSLGLSAKVPDVVERLIKDGKHLEAVSFIHEFGLSGRFPPVPLLKAHLKDSQAGSKTGVEEKNDLLAKELAALKAVLKCIDEYKLKAEYPPDGLHKKVAQLERKKLEKKRGPDTIVVTGKRFRANESEEDSQGGSAFRPSDRPQYGGGNAQSFTQNYGSGYAGGGRGGAYPYTADGQGAVYGNTSYPYTNLPYGGNMPSGYQGSFRR